MGWPGPRDDVLGLYLCNSELTAITISAVNIKESLDSRHLLFPSRRRHFSRVYPPKNRERWKVDIKGSHGDDDRGTVNYGILYLIGVEHKFVLLLAVDHGQINL
jgi:hypothetical protein